LADGRFDVRMRLWDVVRSQDLGTMSYAVVPGELRLMAHRIADFVHEKLTGEKGVFATRIAYVTRVAQRFNLWVADSDGENAQSALPITEPIISPSWSPSGTQLAYVSFESRKPVIYVHELHTGRRRLVADFRGSNSAPTWSPDGRWLTYQACRFREDPGHDWADLCVGRPEGGEHRMLEPAWIGVSLMEPCQS
jgi:TolB protein